MTLRHARLAGYCARGMRQWFAGRDITWQQFVQHGVTADWVQAQQDALADKVLEIARLEWDGQAQAS